MGMHSAVGDEWRCSNHWTAAAGTPPSSSSPENGYGISWTPAICSIYNIASFRRLCSAISENIAYRWVCSLTIDDQVFDHSTITHFINRIGRERFSEVIAGLNDELLRMGLLSPELYVDSSMVKANANNFGLSRSGMTVEEFKEQATETNGLFMQPGPTVDADGAEHDEVRYFQDPRAVCP